jgi:hypothetical protein
MSLHMLGIGIGLATQTPDLAIVILRFALEV